jgi:hypothetical protein
LCCAPGSVLRNPAMGDYYFMSPEIILICFDFSHLLEEDKISDLTQYVLKMVLKHHDFHQEGSEMLPPFIMHVFTKKDKAQAAVIERNDMVVRNMVKFGQISNYLYVSAKTDEGMTELKEAIFNSNIKEEDKMVAADKQHGKGEKSGKQKSKELLSMRLTQSVKPQMQSKQSLLVQSEERKSEGKKKDMENLVD